MNGGRIQEPVVLSRRHIGRTDVQACNRIDGRKCSLRAEGWDSNGKFTQQQPVRRNHRRTSWQKCTPIGPGQGNGTYLYDSLAMPKVIRDQSLTLVVLLLFVISLAGQSLSGLVKYNED